MQTRQEITSKAHLAIRFRKRGETAAQLSARLLEEFRHDGVIAVVVEETFRAFDLTFGEVWQPATTIH